MKQRVTPDMVTAALKRAAAVDWIPSDWDASPQRCVTCGGSHHGMDEESRSAARREMRSILTAALKEAK